MGRRWILWKSFYALCEFLTEFILIPKEIHQIFRKKSGGSLFSYFKICFTDMQYFDSQIPHFRL